MIKRIEAPPGRYEVKLETMKPAALRSSCSRWISSIQAAIVVKTSDPQHPEIAIPVRGMVETRVASAPLPHIYLTAAGIQ